MEKTYKTTYIIPTYNRSRTFCESYSYFLTQKDADKIKVIVVDGSTREHDADANKEFCEKSGFDYYRFVPESEELNSGYIKALYAIKKVQTATVKLCDDEDITSPAAAIKCAEFLEKNEGYSSAAGNYRSCCTQKHKLRTAECYFGKGMEQEDPIARLWSLLFFHEESVFYNVFKTEVLTEALRRTCDPEIRSIGLSLMEIVKASVCVLMGKVKRLDIDYCIRVVHPLAKNIIETSTSRFFGPLKTVDWGKSKEDYSLSVTDAVNIMRDIFKDYIKPYDDIQHDILTITISNYIASRIVSERELRRRKFKAYAKEKGFDLSHYEFIESIYHKPIKTHYNHIPNPRFKGKIAIYGAGAVGEHLYRLLVEDDTFEVECFIDQRYEELGNCLGLKVVAPEASGGLNVDYIVIANDREAAAEEIYETLLEHGADKSKILKLDEFTEGSPVFTYGDYWEKSFGSTDQN